MDQPLTWCNQENAEYVQVCTHGEDASLVQHREEELLSSKTLRPLRPRWLGFCGVTNGL